MSEGVTLTVLTFHPRPWQQQQQRLVSYIISVYLLCTVQTMTPYGSVKDIIVSSSRSLLFEMRRGVTVYSPPSTAGQHTQSGSILHSTSDERGMSNFKCLIFLSSFKLFTTYVFYSYVKGIYNEISSSSSALLTTNW